PQISSLSVGYDWALPQLRGITFRTSAPSLPVPPAGAFAGASPLDTSKDLYPFGEQPRFNDTFYVAVPDALARPGAAVRLGVTLTNPPGAGDDPVKAVRIDGNPRIAWDVSDGQRWRATAATYAFTAN